MTTLCKMTCHPCAGQSPLITEGAHWLSLVVAGRLDILVNAAGMTAFTSDFSEDQATY